MNINRDYLIINDVKKSNVKLDNGSIFFYITDKNTQNIFVNLVINISNNELIQKYANIENAEDYTLTMNIVKPSNTYKVVEGKLHDKENAIFEFNLNEDCCDEIGPYRCELLTKCNINSHEEITTSNKLTYKVKSSILNDLDDIVKAPEYPLVIQLFDKLSDIEQYEEDRRANELARQLAEEQRQTRFDELNVDIDNKMVDVENRISAKEEAVNTLIVDTKADIDGYKVAKDQEIDEYKALKDTEINNAITNQDNKIDTAISEQNDRISNAIATQDNKIDTAINAQNDRITVVENNDVAQDNRLDDIEAKNVEQDNRLDDIEAKNVEQDNRLDDIEAIDVAQNSRLDAIEIKNQQQDDRLLDIEKINKRQDMDLKCLFAESKNNMIDVTEEGNSIYLQNSTVGYTLIDEIQGNTMVNCNKEPDKEIILNGNINTQGYSNVTLTEGVDGGLVDVALEGNTMVNVCDQKDPVAITKSYTVETGNHVALQGEYNGKCRPVVTGNTLWIDNDTEDVLTAFDETKNLRLQSSFEDKLVTQEMVDSGEELAENLGKYKVDYVVTGKNKFDGELELGNINNADGSLSTTALALRSVNFITVIGGETIALSNDMNYCNYIYEYDKDYKFIKYTGKSNEKGSKTITLDNNTKFIKFRSISEAEENNLNVKYQLEYGDTATEYEPYKEYKKTFHLNSPLLEGDTIEQQGNNVVHVHRYKEVVLDGGANENWMKSNMFVECYYMSDYYSSGGLFAEVNILCPTFKSVSNYDFNTNRIDGSICASTNTIGITLKSGTLSYDTLDAFKEWIHNNPVTVVYKLAKPQYEVISQNDTILCDSYVNGHLDVDSIVPIKKVLFMETPKITLKYLYPSTNYIVQFEADNVGSTSIVVGSKNIGTQTIVKGINKFNVTTNGTPNTQLKIGGIGFNASNIVVTEATDQDFGYFEGMKSVGECEDLEVVSSNKNLFDKDKFILGQSLYGYMYLDDKDTYTLSITDKDTSVNTERNIYLGFTGNGRDGNSGTKWLIGNGSVWSTKVTSDRYKYISVYPNNQATLDKLMARFNIQLEKGETATDYISHASNTQTLTHEPLRAVGDIKDKYVLIDGKWYIERNCGTRAYQEGDIDNYITDKISTVYPLATPTYEPIDYNPFTVYSGTTHISNNSTIPCNMTIKNTGYNCLLKPNTTYTVSSNLGLNTVTTPSSLTEDCLRFYDTDTSTVTTMNKVMVLEGDYTTGKPLPSHFSGIESAFEQEYDEEKGKYKVKIRVQNEDASQENYIEFYINEPLRGVGDVKDKVYVKDDKVVVERNCGQRVYQDGDFGAYLTDKINTVYPLAEPIYEEVEYNDVKLFIESFKNSTLFYNGNIPVTSKLYYSYSVPIVDTVAQTANVTDQQDSMIIDLATQVAVMEMMLM